MHFEAHENPYQPPKAEVGAPRQVSQAAKPASSWVMMAVFTLSIVGWAGQQRAIWKEFGVTAFGFNLMTFVTVSCGVGLLALILGPRQRWAYFVVVTIYALHMGIYVVTTIPGISADNGALIFTSFVPTMGLRLWLFYRFTWGIPSRRYYGIAVTDETTASTS